ncbi:MAG: quinolinate synthase NadA, partial [Candidatus Aminicenantes bacterium]
LQLSREAAKLDCEVIVFCGVHFMAETAAILAPDKTVLIPDFQAGCPMADMITGAEMRSWKEEYPGNKVVCYVNTTAEVKAECDICCTSANVLKVVASIEDDTILFAPDKNLAAYAARFTDTKIIPWDGYCYVHHKFRPRHVEDKRGLFPDAEVWVHPECRPEVIDLADKVLSTGQMVKEAQVTHEKRVILGTEEGIIHRLKKINPGTQFIPLRENAICSNMKKIDLSKVERSLRKMKFRVAVADDIRQRARGAIEAMIRIV